MARIAVVGSYGVGLTFGSPRAPERGETVIGTLFRTDDGGKGSNQAVGAARLGAEVSFLTAVGEDAFGDRAHELWEREGVDASAVLRSAEPTMTAAILVEESGDNRIVIVPGALATLTRPTWTASRRKSRPPTSCWSSWRSRSTPHCTRWRSAAPPVSARC